MRSHSTRCGAAASPRYGAHSAPSAASYACRCLPPRARGIGGGWPRRGTPVEGVDAIRPAPHAGIAAVLRDQLVDVAQQMRPAVLVAPVVAGVGRIEVADQHPAVVVPHDRLQHRPLPAAPHEERARSAC